MAKMPCFLLFAMTTPGFLASITFFILFPSWSLFQVQFDSLKLLNCTNKSPAVTTAALRRWAGGQASQIKSLSISSARKIIHKYRWPYVICVCLYKEKDSLLPPGALGIWQALKGSQRCRRVMLLRGSVLNAIAGDHISAFNTIKQKAPAEQ